MSSNEAKKLLMIDFKLFEMKLDSSDSLIYKNNDLSPVHPLSFLRIRFINKLKKIVFSEPENV